MSKTVEQEPVVEGLLPCPFCGTQPRLEQRETQSLWSSNEVTFSQVVCNECDVQGQDFCDDPTGEQAIEWWNKRPASPAAPDVGQLVEVLEEARDALAIALRVGAPDWYPTHESVSSHSTIKLIDEALGDGS